MFFSRVKTSSQRWVASAIATLLSVSASAHSGGTDAFGCHRDKKHGGYHCHHGLYEGLSFESKEDGLTYFKAHPSGIAEEDEKVKSVPAPLVPATDDSAVEQPPAPTSVPSPSAPKDSPASSDAKIDLPSLPDKLLSVVSWNMHKLGRKNFDADAAALVLETADIVAFQEVDQNLEGQVALNQLRNKLAAKLNTKMCWALSAFPSGERIERYAYIWKNDRIAYVKTNTDIMTDCPETAITIRLGVKHADRIVREPAYGTFYFKPAGAPFILASVHLVPTKKSPEDEVSPLFDTFKGVKGPIIVAGDFNLGDDAPAFDEARKLDFDAALHSEKTSLMKSTRELNACYDNFWFKGLVLERHAVVNLFDAFENLSVKTINNSLSDHSPIQGFFNFLTKPVMDSSEESDKALDGEAAKADQEF